MREWLTKPDSLREYLLLLCTSSYPRIQALLENSDIMFDTADPARLSGKPEGIDHPMKTAKEKAVRSVTHYNDLQGRKKVGYAVDVGVTVNDIELHNLKRAADVNDQEMMLQAEEEAYAMYCLTEAMVVWTIGLTLHSDDEKIDSTGGIEIAARYNKLDEAYVRTAFARPEVRSINTRVPMVELAATHAQYITAKNVGEDVRRRAIEPQLAQQLVVGGRPTQSMLNALARGEEKREWNGLSVVHLPLPRRD